MMGLYKAFPDLFLEQCRQMSYYSNLGLFWEVMARFSLKCLTSMTKEDSKAFQMQ